MSASTTRRKSRRCPIAPTLPDDAPVYRLVNGDLDKPFRLLAEGPQRYAEILGGDLPHQLSLAKWAREGSRGFRLRTVRRSRCLVCTPRWLLDFAVACAGEGAK